MRLAHSETTPWTPVPPVRGGTIEFKTMLEGDENTPDNYQLLLANTDLSFKSPRHRHNFDQLRFSLVGDTNIGVKRNLAEGDLAYFPEGTYYGPQDQESVGKESLAMVVQFGGPSGNGYMSRRQMSESFAKLEKEGRFEGGVYKRNTPAPDGRMNQDSYEAIWEYQNGRPIEYSKPRFMDPVHFRERNFEWQAVPVESGAATKHIASFTEKGVAVFCVQIDAGASYTLPAAPQTQLLFVQRGTGNFGVGEGHWSAHTAAHFSAGESAHMTATALTEAVILQLPRI